MTDLLQALSHELAEAKSEIARHHSVIKRLRDELRWSLDQLAEGNGLGNLGKEGRGRFYEARKFLNREVA